MANENLPPYQNNPRSLISNYSSGLERAPMMPHKPSARVVDFAEKTLKEMKWGETPYALLRITQHLNEMNGDALVSVGSCTTTDLFVHLFLNEPNRLPKRWLESDDYIRTIISMTANLDISQMKNDVIQAKFDDDLSTAENRTNPNIESLEKLIQDLQARTTIAASGQTS
ncbi:hypothetical protein M1328_00755 [Patescibacteria group bacterium]|nr:hypothetical protein [Patescibacteria group bacterium]